MPEVQPRRVFRTTRTDLCLKAHCSWHVRPPLAVEILFHVACSMSPLLRKKIMTADNVESAREHPFLKTMTQSPVRMRLSSGTYRTVTNSSGRNSVTGSLNDIGTTHWSPGPLTSTYKVVPSPKLRLRTSVCARSRLDAQLSRGYI